MSNPHVHSRCRRNRRSSALAPLLCAVLLCACHARESRTDSVATKRNTAPPSAAFVERRADWAAFIERLPTNPIAAAAALDRYRQENGLPFPFMVKLDSSAGAARGLHVRDEEIGGGSSVTVFLGRMPDSLSVLHASPVYELNEEGSILRGWSIPQDVEFWTVVEGVVGDELITAYREVRANVHLYFRPDGTYRVSAGPPPPLAPLEWIDVGDSTWLQVLPGSVTGATRTARGGHGNNPGRWAPTGDPGWYVRLDTVPGLPVRAHAVTFDEPGAPLGTKCPETPRFGGMLCAIFSSPGGKRILAYPVPMT